MPPKTAKEVPVERNRRRVVSGVVTSDKMAKTITVRVERLVQHPMYAKTLRKYVTCYAHDEKAEAKTGDLVELAESRPLSKLKNWRLLRIVAKSASSPEGDARNAARPSKAAASPPPAPSKK